MITSWRDDVRRRGQLRIVELAGAGNEPWSGVVARAVTAFNELSAAHDLGVTYRRVDATGDAEVTVDTYANRSLIGSARITREGPAGRPDSELRVTHVEIRVPDDPRVSTPSAYRRVGPGVLLAMMVHEMIHACGLSNSEHSPSGDMFQASPDVLIGDTPAGDRMSTGLRDGSDRPIGMPPLRLTDGTAAKIRQAWPAIATDPPGARSPKSSRLVKPLGY